MLSSASGLTSTRACRTGDAPRGGDAVNGTRRIATLSVLLGTLLLSLALASSSSASPVSSKKAQLRAGPGQAPDRLPPGRHGGREVQPGIHAADTVTAQIKENERLLKVAEYNLGVANEQLSARAPRHLQDARRRRRRRPLRRQQLRRPRDPAQPHGAAGQQRRRHRQEHRRLPAGHQGPPRQARRRQEGGRQAGRRGAPRRRPRSWACRASSSR